jgi:uncharacterized protein YcbK (DUF882 family)
MGSPNILLQITILAALCLLQTACSVSPNPPSIADYERWKAKGENASNVTAFSTFLKNQGISEVIPLYQLLRSDVRWRECHAEAFIVPPRKFWSHMVPTLKLVQNEIVPVVGRVEALSVFRSPSVNRCIGGANKSFHLNFYAIDMKPKLTMSRKKMIKKLCYLHRHKGKYLNMGLGIYSGTRFHIDAAGYREWGDDYKSTSSPCRSLVAPQHKPR